METIPRIPVFHRLALTPAALLALACSCRQQEGGNQSPPRADSLPAGVATDSATTRPDTVEQTPQDSASWIQSLRWPEHSGEPDLSEIISRSIRLVEVKRRLDDLARAARNTADQDGSGPDSSSAVNIPFEDSLSAWIREYRAFLAQPSSNLPWPGRVESTLYVPSGLDNALPKVSASKFLEGRSVFLVGGAPFLDKVLAEEGTAFLDLDGKPEFRYATTHNRAASHLVAAMRAIPGTRMDVRSGPPLDDYESGPYGVGGIGSLDHVATTPIRAWFLTKSGPVPARVVSVGHKLFEPGFCGSHLPHAVFASATLPGDEIFGVYFPRDGIAPRRSIVTRKGKLATVDLDGDGIPEYAAVVESFTGVADDELNKAAWFVNVGGTWKPIDAGSHEDCT